MCETFAIDNQRDFEVKEHNETYVENVERVDCIFRFWKDDLQAGKAGRLGAPYDFNHRKKRTTVELRVLKLYAFLANRILVISCISIR